MPNRTVSQRFSALLLIMAVMVGLASLPGAASALTLYDTLAKSPINASKWTAYESVRVIDATAGTNNPLRLGVRSGPATTGPVMSNLNFLHPSVITSKFEANITLLKYLNGSGPNAMAMVGGRFYNDGTSSVANDCTGDVLGQAGLGGSATNPVAVWTVVRYTSADCNSSEVLASGSFSNTAVVTGTAYPASVEWDGSKFTFGVNGKTHSYTPFTAINVPNRPYKGLYTRISNNAGKDAFILAQFSGVKGDGTAYPFGDVIDQTVWANSEFVRAMKDDEKHLVLLAKGSTNSTSSVESYLPIAGPGSVGTIQATVTAKQLATENRAKANVFNYVGGRFFNDGSEGSGFVGDIGAFVRLQPTSDGTGYTGKWKVTRFTGTSVGQQEDIAEGNSRKLISLNKAYILSVGWDGTKFTFRGGNETFTYTPPVTITANATNAKVPYKGLSSVVTGAGVNATAIGYFTNVMIGPAPHFLTVGVTGTGTVTSAPAGIVCNGEGGTCSKAFPHNTRVTLVAKPAAGWTLQGWSGACTGKTCSVLVNDAKSALATFIKSPTALASPATKNFGNVRLTKSAVAVFTVFNKTTKGIAPLQIGQITLSAFQDEFTLQDDNCSNKTVVSNGKCTFKVKFAAHTVGRNKTLNASIPSNDLASPLAIKIYGTAIK